MKQTNLNSTRYRGKLDKTQLSVWLSSCLSEGIVELYIKQAEKVKAKHLVIDFPLKDALKRYQLNINL